MNPFSIPSVESIATTPLAAINRVTFFGFRSLTHWFCLVGLGLVLTGSLQRVQLDLAAQETDTSPPNSLQSQQPHWDGEATAWNGFARFDFQVAGRAAYVVQPEHPAPGFPWVFRARFPDFHTEADLILLQRGFHIARINTDGMLGSPDAMQAWDQFYQYLTERGLSSRCALEGVSRGGLFVYGFAARWPTRVACLYADTPVCDIRSWPGGQGTGLGSPETWASCLTQYGLTEATAKEFRDQPIDRFQPLIDHRIPILHIISMNDQVVPPEENTLELQRRMKAAGGNLDVIRVAQGTAQSHGHHFTHPDPVRVADFIERHATVLGREQDFSLDRGSLAHAATRFRNTGTGRVAFVGGSITNMDGWRLLTMDYLQAKFPDTQFEFINAGIPSTGSVPGAFRLKHDVLAHGEIDLMFEEASVNDLTNARTPVQMVRGMEGIVRHARRVNPSMDLVIMHFACPAHSADYRSGKIPEVIQKHEAVAGHYSVSTIDLAREVTTRIDAGQFDWQADFRDLHPSPMGHRLYASSIRRLLSAAWDAADANPPGEAPPLPASLDRFSYDDGDYVGITAARRPDQNGFLLIPDCDPRQADVGGGVRPGFFNVPMLVGTQPGQSFQLPFQGRAVGLMVAAGPDAGWIEFQIDDGPLQKRNLHTRWSDQLHLPWAYVLADELAPDQPHTLTVSIPPPTTESEKNRRNACRIVYFLVNR